MIAAEAAKLSAAQRDALFRAEPLVDGRVLVPFYAVPDHLTRIYSAHRAALNRLGLAVKAHLEEEASAHV